MMFVPGLLYRTPEQRLEFADRLRVVEGDLDSEADYLDIESKVGREFSNTYRDLMESLIQE